MAGRTGYSIDKNMLKLQSEVETLKKELEDLKKRVKKVEGLDLRKNYPLA